MPFPLLAVAATVVGIVLGVVLSRQQKAPRQRPGEFTRPKAAEGDPIPVIFGTVDIRDSNTVDFGDTRTKPNYVEAGGKK